tara:strand:+ start:2983 stop:3174 length:192 start_codon:yes stop_codon:yes gene_type:complete
MAKEVKKSQKTNGYKATDPAWFAANHTDVVPYYGKLSEGESVKVDLKNKHVIGWIANKIIVKE